MRAEIVRGEKKYAGARLRTKSAEKLIDDTLSSKFFNLS